MPYRPEFPDRSQDPSDRENEQEIDHAFAAKRLNTRALRLRPDVLLLDPTPLARGLVRKKVEVVNYPDGRFAVQFNGTALDFKVFDKIQTVQPGAIVDNKRLSAVLEHIKSQQAAYPAHQQRGHVARQRPPNNFPGRARGSARAPRLRKPSISATFAAVIAAEPMPQFFPHRQEARAHAKARSKRTIASDWNIGARAASYLGVFPDRVLSR
jgi:hypothetical protein